MGTNHLGPFLLSLGLLPFLYKAHEQTVCVGGWLKVGMWECVFLFVEGCAVVCVLCECVCISSP